MYWNIIVFPQKNVIIVCQLKKKIEPSTVAKAYNLNIWEAEEEDCPEFKVNLGWKQKSKI